MPSSLKLSDLPVSNEVNASDLFLSYDVEAGTSRKVTLEAINRGLFMTATSDYEAVLGDISTMTETIADIIGDEGDFDSLSVLNAGIKANDNAITALAQSLRAQVSLMNQNIDTQVMARNNSDNRVVERVEDVEDFTLHAGLASGFLYVKTFQGG